MIVDENIDETYGINVQFEESEEEVSVTAGLVLLVEPVWTLPCQLLCSTYANILLSRLDSE